MRTYHWTRLHTAALALTGMVLAGCTYTVMPKHVPYTKGSVEAILTEASVLVVSAEKNSGESPVLTEQGKKSGLLADRQAWTRKLVEVLAAELARRGAKVRSDAPVTLGLSIPSITFVETRAEYQLSLKVAVTSSTGWSKEYAGSAQEKRYRVVSVDAEADRLAGLALSDAVRAMLNDPELTGQVRPAGKK